MNKIKLSREEFMGKYGDVMVSFRSYYKYTFSYAGQLPDGKIVAISYGGSADDIYRYQVTAGQLQKIRDLEPRYGVVSEGENEIEDFYENC